MIYCKRYSISLTYVYFAQLSVCLLYFRLWNCVKVQLFSNIFSHASTSTWHYPKSDLLLPFCQNDIGSNNERYSHSAPIWFFSPECWAVVSAISLPLQLFRHGFGWREGHWTGGFGSGSFLRHDPCRLRGQGDPGGPNQSRHVSGHPGTGEKVCGHQPEDLKGRGPAQEALCPLRCGSRALP